MGGQALVHELGADAEAALQALREAPGKPADWMFGAVGVRGEPDHQQRRPPLGDQPLDRGKARAILRAADGVQRMRDPGLEIADRDADAPGAEVERENAARPGVRREG